MGTTGNQYDDLRAVMNKCRAWEKYRIDRKQFGVDDFWRIPMIDDQIDLGDCEDWAMRFAWELEANFDWPSSNVNLALCGLRNGQGHLVTLATTVNGHFVLDCRQRYPLPPRHRFLNIKSWYAITPLNVAEWKSVSAPGGPLPLAFKNGDPNSEFLFIGSALKAHPKHIEWLKRKQERTAK